MPFSSDEIFGPIPFSSVQDLTAREWEDLLEKVEDIVDPGRRMREREKMIAAALETPEGRAALASAMVEPIRRSLDYQGIGRKLLMVDELPQGAYATYEKSVVSAAKAVAKKYKTKKKKHGKKPHT